MLKLSITKVSRNRVWSGKIPVNAVYADVNSDNNTFAGQIAIQSHYSKETGANYKQEPQDVELINITFPDKTIWGGSFADLQKKLYQDAGEIAMIAAVIAHNCFDELSDHYNDGGTHCMHAISFLASRFELKYRHVTEWSDFLENSEDEEVRQLGASDWEEFVCKWAILHKDLK